MNIYKITNKITHKELVERFIKVNTGVKVIDWQPNDEDGCKIYAVEGQPIIKVDIEGGNWLRVYIDKETNEITWY